MADSIMMVGERDVAANRNKEAGAQSRTCKMCGSKDRKEAVGGRGQQLWKLSKG